MRTNRWFFAMGVAAAMLTGWTSVAEASTCSTSTDCTNSAPICVLGICKPCSDDLVGGLSCTLSGHPTFTCSNGSCVDPNASTSSSSSSSSSSTGGLDLGGILGGVTSSSSSSSSSGSTTGTNTVCVADSDCGAGTGEVCDSSTHECVLGCRVGLGTGCLLGLACQGIVGDIGTCLVPETETAPPATNTTCKQDSDCGEVLSGTVCNAEGLCVAGCRVSSGNTCPVDLDCFANSVDLGICVPPSDPTGCKADSDCGSANSGEVCDTANGSCIPGCRITGGNGCPVGLSCDVNFDTFGLCIVPTPSSSSSSSSSSGSSGSSGSSSGSSGKTDGGSSTTYPESRNPISSTGGTSSSSSSSGAAVKAADDLSVEGGGCNVSDNNVGGGASLAGLLFGAAVLVSRRRRAA